MKRAVLTAALAALVAGRSETGGGAVTVVGAAFVPQECVTVTWPACMDWTSTPGETERLDGSVHTSYHTVCERYEWFVRTDTYVDGWRVVTNVPATWNDGAKRFEVWVNEDVAAGLLPGGELDLDEARAEYVRPVLQGRKRRPGDFADRTDASFDKLRGCHRAGYPTAGWGDGS